MPDSLSTRIFHQESQSYQADSAEEPQKPEKSFTLRQKEEPLYLLSSKVMVLVMTGGVLVFEMSLKG